MKFRIIHTLFLFAVLLVVPPAYGQVLEENEEVRTFLDEMFQHLEKDRVPYGLLEDYAFDLVELNAYNGVELNDGNYINRQTYEFLLRSIRSSAVNTPPFGDVYTLLTKQYAAGNNHTAAISAMAYQYSVIKANALTDGLIRYENEKVYDCYQNGVWQNPYESRYVTGFCTHDSIFIGSSLTFELPQDCWFSNLSCRSMEIGLDNGSYKPITIGGSVSFSNLAAGLHDVTLKIKLQDETVLTSRSRIRMIIKENIATRGFMSDWLVIGEAYKGIKTGAEVTVESPFSNQKKVMIVVEGFDPRFNNPNDSDVSTEKKKGYCCYGNFLENLGGYYRQLISSKYNIVYVDWIDSGEYIQANANTLIKVIAEINKMKQSVENNQPNVVLGHSMGGLVARYALKKMENENIKHNTSYYISCDAPHLGANVPLGALYLLHGVTDFFDKKSNLDKWTGAGTKLESFLKIAHCHSAQQMMVNYVDFAGNLINTKHQEWQQELAMLGFPQGDGITDFRMLCISNSGYSVACDVPDAYLKVNFSGSTDILGILYPLGASLVGGISLGIALQDFWVGVLETLFPGKTTLKGNIDVNPAIIIGNIITNLTIKYKKKYLWLVNITKTIYSYRKNFYGDLAYDGFPSSRYRLLDGGLSYEDGVNIPVIVDGDISLKMESRVPFIPVSSALCVGKGIAKLTETLFTMVPSINDTPFGDNIFMHTLNGEDHSTILGSNSLSWLIAQLELGIVGPKMGITGSKYIVPNHEADVIQWMSSDENLATINSNGVLTVKGKGIVTITANVGGYSVSKQIMVGTPRFILDEVKRSPGYYTVKATCIDTQNGYADFVAGNKEVITYMWGIKTNEEPLRWVRSDSPILKLSTLEEKDNTTIYLKTIDMYGTESNPLYVRISGYDIWELSNNVFIFNNKGDVYDNKGRKLFYRSSSISVSFREQSQGAFNNAKWSPGYAILITDEEVKDVPWNGEVRVKDIFQQTDIDRIISSPDNTVWVYKLILLNHEKKVIQRTPITVMYKANFPN